MKEKPFTTMPNIRLENRFIYFWHTTNRNHYKLTLQESLEIVPVERLHILCVSRRSRVIIVIIEAIRVTEENTIGIMVDTYNSIPVPWKTFIPKWNGIGTPPD